MPSNVSGTARQNAGKRTPTASRTTTVTLLVHPWHGETVTVLKPFGPDAIWIERRDGDVRIVPLAWTALSPRAVPGRVVPASARLSPESALGLVAWVRARLETGPEPHDA